MMWQVQSYYKSSSGLILMIGDLSIVEYLGAYAAFAFKDKANQYLLLPLEHARDLFDNFILGYVSIEKALELEYFTHGLLINNKNIHFISRKNLKKITSDLMCQLFTQNHKYLHHGWSDVSTAIKINAQLEMGNFDLSKFLLLLNITLARYGIYTFEMSYDVSNTATIIHIPDINEPAFKNTINSFLKHLPGSVIMPNALGTSISIMANNQPTESVNKHFRKLYYKGTRYAKR